MKAKYGIVLSILAIILLGSLCAQCSDVMIVSMNGVETGRPAVVPCKINIVCDSIGCFDHNVEGFRTLQKWGRTIQYEPVSGELRFVEPRTKYYSTGGTGIPPSKYTGVPIFEEETETVLIGNTTYTIREFISGGLIYIRQGGYGLGGISDRTIREVEEVLGSTSIKQFCEAVNHE